MFLSLKWKAVVFLSIVLLLITLAWVGQNVHQTIDSFQAARQSRLVERQQILDQLLADNFLKLSQFGQLITEKPMIRYADKDHQEAPFQLSKRLQEDWVALNINLGLDYLAVYDQHAMELGMAYSENRFPELDELKTLLLSRVAQSAQGTPQSLIFCDIGCAQFIVEPIVFANGRPGSLVLGVDMAGVVAGYYEYARSDLAILLARQGERGPNRLESWQLDAWAVSRFESLFPVLQSYSRKGPLGVEDEGLFFGLGKDHYRLTPLSLAMHDTAGRGLVFVDIVDESKAREQLQTAIVGGVGTGVLGLIFSEVVLILLMLGPLRRLARIDDALKLLPQHAYDDAREQIVKRRGRFGDELTTLEDSTLYVIKALGHLHRDLQDKNGKLEQQVLAVSRSRSFLTRLFDSSHLFILTQDLTFGILKRNALFETLVPVGEQRFLSLFTELAEQQTLRRLVSELVAGGESLVQQEMAMVDPQGQARYISWTHTLVEDEQGQSVVLSVGTDLTHRKEAENTLQWMANHDSLTGINNRRAFNEHLRYLLSRETEGALVFIDINRFKQINDLYGHLVGDEVLTNIAETLRQHTRATDFVSRLAGDEFTVILTRVNRETVQPVLEKLAEQLSGQLELEDKRVIDYSASLGVSFFPEQGTDEQSLILHADRAMYQAKKKGLGRWHIYDPQDDDLLRVKKDHDLMVMIKQALNADLFQLVFQPIVALDAGRISHYEVLLRMRDESGRPISPGEFIPVAERVGLIRAIDNWVLAQALAFLAEQLESDPSLTFAVNVSAPSLQDRAFPGMVLQGLASFGIPSSRLIIELTETAYIDNFAQVLQNLKLLADAGVQIALDDFGVGFSSFNYLKRMPLTYVKLDGSYIRHLTDNRDNQIFVESLSRMVNAFGMKTIAEFVEDQPTYEMLGELGVAMAQGYYVGKPDAELLSHRQLALPG